MAYRTVLWTAAFCGIDPVAEVFCLGRGVCRLECECVLENVCHNGENGKYYA